MKIKNFEELKAYLRARPDSEIRESIPQDLNSWEDILSFMPASLWGEPLEIILHPDKDNIYTSYANADVQR